MLFFLTFVSFIYLVTLVRAWNAPIYSGYTRIWHANFVGAAGNLPNEQNWSVITGDLSYNNEIQRYTRMSKNVRFSGSGTLQLIPLRDSSVPGGWTSSRIESKYTFTPGAGKITRVEASLRLAGSSAATMKGIWPAFWMLGDSHRRGTPWPQCGEIDILENINGEKVASGALHCDVSPGGICNEGIGLTSTTSFTDTNYHVWRIEFDRRDSNFRSQTITWYKDGSRFGSISGSRIGNSKIWTALCHSPFYFILNVAVGGNWPGLPNSSTKSGIDNMMEVGYVAHYVSS